MVKVQVRSRFIQHVVKMADTTYPDEAVIFTSKSLIAKIKLIMSKWF